MPADSEPADSRQALDWIPPVIANPETNLILPESNAQALGELMDDLPAAARWAEARVSEVQRVDAIRRVALAWGEKDSTAAFAWAEKLTDPELRRVALENICAAMIKTEPGRAMDLALHYGLVNGEFKSVQALVRDWAFVDFSAAFEWASAQPPDGQRDQIMAHLALVQARLWPVEAATLVAQQMAAGPLQEQAAVAVVQEWALQDLDGAIKWVELFPPGASRDKAIDVLEAVVENRRLMSLSAAPPE